jgi:DNA-binding transcriptional ArsR family regulator
MDVLAALADDTRRRVVELLAERPRPAGELAAQFAISQPAVSRHLRVLRDCGLVRAEVAGQQRVYHLEAAPLVELDEWLAHLRAFWSQRLDALETELARGRRTAPRPRTTTKRSTDQEAM